MGDNHGTSSGLNCCFGMMTRTQLYARTGAAAIAAVLALSSTQIAAQAAQPVTTEPVTTTPAPPPAATEPVATPDPLAPATEPTATSTTKTTTTRTTARRTVRTAPAKPAPVATRTVTRNVTTHTATTAPVAAAIPPAAPPAPAAKPAPVVNLSAQRAAPPPQPAAAEPAFQLNQNELLLGGGALALVALAAAAIAVRRRRRLRIEEEEAAQYEHVEPMSQDPIFDKQPASAEPEPVLEQTPRHDPIFDRQPAIVAPPMSAFPQTTPPRQEVAAGDCAELESWTERAKCGPTADNPSQSLKKRLKRAAFFEQRDREVAAGNAAPVDADAGLPDAVEEPSERA
jgi:hypothetical protein